MKIKGTAVQSIPYYIKKQHADSYSEWLNALPAASQQIFKGMIITSGWFPISDALTIPLKTTAALFFQNNQEKTARTMGRFSADDALSGVYKFFVRMGSPKFLIERSTSLMKTYFQPCEIQVLYGSQNGCTMQITHFPESDEIIEWNIAGWIERALEVSGCKSASVIVTKSLAKHDNMSELTISWVL
jgi:hypothetical protein